MDDEIIYYWCFHDVECFDSTPSVAIIILDKDLEGFSSMSSQHLYDLLYEYVGLLKTHKDVSKHIPNSPI